ncbi:MAG: hydrogen peroxide-inducible genes activator [Bradymonadaceae bacterium]
MKLTQLRYAQAVREEGSMSAAAEACHVSQPSLSEAIQNLEQSLGVPLFERTSSGTRCTEAGRTLLDRAEEVLERADELRELAGAVSSDVLEGRFDIGVIETVGPYLLPRALTPVERRYPKLDLVVREGLTDDLLEAVRARNLDAAVIALPWDLSDEFVQFQAYREAFYAVLPPDDPLADREAVDPDALQPQDLLLLVEGHCLRAHALDVCEFPVSDLRRKFRSSSLETIRGMVAAGWGVSLFPSLALDEDEEVVVRPLSEPAYRDIVVVSRRSHPRRECLSALAEALGDAVGDLAEAGDRF